MAATTVMATASSSCIALSPISVAATHAIIGCLCDVPRPRRVLMDDVATTYSCYGWTPLLSYLQRQEVLTTRSWNGDVRLIPREPDAIGRMPEDLAFS